MMLDPRETVSHLKLVGSEERPEHGGGGGGGGGDNEFEAHGQSIWNCWFMHDWDIWLDGNHGPVKSVDGATTGHYVEQSRRCWRCGKLQMRTVWA